MSNIIYNEYKAKVTTIPWETSNLKVMLVSGYSPDIDVESNKDDIDNLAVEISGTGYTAGGQALANLVVIRDDQYNAGKHDADDTLWPNSTLSATGAIVYFDSGSAATSTLVTYVDFLQTVETFEGDFTIKWNSDGIIKTT